MAQLRQTAGAFGAAEPTSIGRVESHPADELKKEVLRLIEKVQDDLDVEKATTEALGTSAVNGRVVLNEEALHLLYQAAVSVSSSLSRLSTALTRFNPNLAIKDIGPDNCSAGEYLASQVISYAVGAGAWLGRQRDMEYYLDTTGYEYTRMRDFLAATKQAIVA